MKLWYVTCVGDQYDVAIIAGYVASVSQHHM